MCFGNIDMIYQGMGWLGTLLFLVSYYLLVTKKWRLSSYAFHISNLLGGILLGINTYVDHSYPAAFINIAWALLALYGMYNDKWRKRGRPHGTDNQ